MELITASKLDSLSSEQSRKFQGLLPELVKRLIIDSVSELSSLRIPGCDDIWAPGFDGVVECKEGTLYVNSGKSVWEFGNVNASLDKVNSDYEKRTLNPLGLDKKETTYYAIIPKIWAFDNKGWPITKWEASKKDWKAVKVYDASVLCDWINKCPAVLTWLFERIYEEEHLDFTTVSKAWEFFSKTTDPPFAVEMFSSGRNDEEQEFLKILKNNKNNVLKIKAKTSMDSYGFCLSCLLKSDLLRNSVIVVNDNYTYKQVSEVCNGKIILLKSMDIDSFIDGNTTIVCYNNEAVRIEPDIYLSSIKKKDFVSALKKMGISENELEDFYYHTHGELFALVRRIPGLINQYKPKWSSHKDIKSLYPLLFLRNIDVNNEADKYICKLLGGEEFDIILAKYNDFLKLDDSPIKKIENIYSIVSYEEAWTVLSPSIDGNEIKDLTNSLKYLIDVCSGSTNDDLHLKYRAKKIIYNLSLNYLYYSYSFSGNDKLRKYIDIILEKIWDSYELLSVIRLYAESEPELVMNILEDDFSSENSHIKTIFSDVGYGSNYTHILSSIDVLVTNKFTKIRACNLLFEMCKIKGDYFYHSKPIESLLDALWLQYNEGDLSLNEKKKLALKYLEDDDIGVGLIFNLLIKDSSIRNVRIGGKKRIIQEFSFNDYFEAVLEISYAFVKKILCKKNIYYIERSITSFCHFPVYVIRMLLDKLKETDFEFIDKLRISYEVRSITYLSRKHRKTEYPEYVKLFEEFIGVIEEKKWDDNSFFLFYKNYYDCPIVDSPFLNDDYENFQEEEEYVKQLRIKALNNLFTENNREKESILLSIMGDEVNWGYILAESDLQQHYEYIIHKIIENKKYNLLSGFLDKISPSISYRMLIGFPFEVKKKVLLSINNREIALLLQDDNLKTIFWSNKRMLHYSDYDYEQLMKYNPSGLLSYYIIINRSDIFKNKNLIINILLAMIRSENDFHDKACRERDLIIKFFMEMESNAFYSDDIAVVCLELTRFNYDHRIFECIKKYYYYHPEKICQIIAERSDGYFTDYEFEWYYELPKCAFEYYDNLKSFIQFIIDTVSVNNKDEAYILIGKLLARALDVGVSEKNNTIFKIVDNFNNKELDSGFISGYDSLNHVRQIGDGSDQKEVYDMLNKTSEDVEIDFPHTASLLRIISKHYLTNSKTDFVTSELGPEVI